MISEFIDIRDNRWLKILENTAHDVYHLPDYVKHAASIDASLPVAYYGQYEGTTILIPFLRRTLPLTLTRSEMLYDAISPYGYSSPLIYTPEQIDENYNISQLLNGFIVLCQQHRLISAFLRFHPLIPFPLDVFQKYGSVVYRGPTITIDLGLTTQELAEQIRDSHKTEIKQAVEKGFSVILNDWNLLPAFIELYRSTMDRVSANRSYYFSKTYFEELYSTLGDAVHLCIVFSPEGEVACGGLFFTASNIVQYHLSGTAEKYRKDAPTKLMLEFVKNWGKQQGYRYFHLGGGVGAKEDSLLKFKAGFSRMKSEFYTYQLIFDQHQYNSLIVLRSQQTNEIITKSDYFPLYRK